MKECQNSRSRSLSSLSTCM